MLVKDIPNGSIVWNGYSVLGIKGVTLDPAYDECLVIQESGNPIDFSIVKNDTWKAVRQSLKK